MLRVRDDVEAAKAGEACNEVIRPNEKRHESGSI
jgi:hypothetical protein